ncbi:MAG: tetratricopeptide repeat protein, partial [Myxococcota bacterium]
GGPLEFLREQLDKFFADLNEAHQMLTNPTEREHYDRQLQRAAKSGHAPPEDLIKAEELYTMAKVLLRQKNFTEATQKLEQICQLAPTTGDYEADYAWAHYKQHPKPQQIWQETIEQLKLARRHKADPARVAYYLGEVYDQQSERRDAVKAFEEFLKLAPHDARANNVRQKLRLYRHERIHK